jgi:hypothetical protein
MIKMTKIINVSGLMRKKATDLITILRGLKGKTLNTFRYLEDP